MTTLNAPTVARTATVDEAPQAPAALVVDRRAEERRFGLLLLAVWPFFLLLAIGARGFGAGASGRDERSLFQVATEAARSTLAIALNL